MPELSEYELEDGSTVQLTEEDAKRIPGAKKVGKPHTQAKEPAGHQHEPVRNRARR